MSPKQNRAGIKPATLDTLKALCQDLKGSTLSIGQYPPPYDAALWERRDKSKAFRCIAYNQNVRRISALEDAIRALERLEVAPSLRALGRDPDKNP